MTDDKKVFERLHADDKRALKRFMTGQIQNILANEYGIGGTKTLKGQIEQAIREEVAHQINRLGGDDKLLELIADRLISVYARDRGRAQTELKKEIKEATQKAITDLVSEAAGRIQINVSIAEDPVQTRNKENPNFGRF